MNDYIYVIMHPLANNTPDGQTDRQADKQMDGRMDGWLNLYIRR